MIKQRRELIALYRQGNRPELARAGGARDRGHRELPAEADERGGDRRRGQGAIAETGAAGIKDMGKVMGVLRERHAGVIDMARAGAVVKQLLG